MALNMEEWNRIQQDARNGKWGDFALIRACLCQRAANENPEQGISSSDVNHMVYSFFKGREDMPAEDAICELMEASA